MGRLKFRCSRFSGATGFGRQEAGWPVVFMYSTIRRTNKTHKKTTVRVLMLYEGDS